MSSLVASKELDERIHEVDKTILIETSRETKGKSNGKVTVILHAEDDSTVSLRLTYSKCSGLRRNSLRLLLKYYCLSVVSNAKWEPVYDLHASTKETKSVVLHYRAHIVQTTGEDWKETELTLSTTAALTNEIPRLGVYQIKAGDHPFKKFNAPQPPVSLFGSTAPTQAIRGTGGFGAFGAPASAGTLFGAAPSQTQTSDRVFGFGNAQTAPVVSGGLFGMAQPIQPPQFQQMPQYTQQQQSQQQAAFSTVPVASDERFRERERERVERSDPTAQVGVPFPDENTVDEFTGDYSVVDFGPGELPVAIVEGTATIRTSPLSAQFLVQGLANIPSDGEAHTVSIASSLTFDAVVTRVAVPRLRAQVYLQSRVKNVSEYRLLPGSVSIFLDEGYVSKSSIGVSLVLIALMLDIDILL